MKSNVIVAAALLLALATSGSHAADLIRDQEGTPVPPPQTTAELGIWGAIALSERDLKHGMFWGADTRNEAEATARRYCENSGGSDCSVVEVYRNHRHWTDDDGSGFPYNYCAALALDQRTGKWGSASATSKAEAARDAVGKCGADQCKVVELGCT